MKIGIRHPKDFYAGLFFVAIGVAAIVIARQYPMGSLVRMGTGYFPTVLGTALALCGTALAARALVIRGGVIEKVAWRPALRVLGSIVAFGLALRPLGLIAAILPIITLAPAVRAKREEAFHE